ncbi:Cytochrome c [Roseovarius nanhaiticus]|uniref:Cytochrome c n=1 Tax=Roseovarius nanhaiticus TaxID=573024 RepID=A0A1N7EWC6_9RHOB|nr:cytochrome c [Roseovarius nanhaiticus]SEK65490.1 Cytochrome c [Roseovarius nanhaiticus]SIR92350.1 Cytochrome c [Roseovarius nanhaiticus]
MNTKRLSLLALLAIGAAATYWGVMPQAPQTAGRSMAPSDSNDIGQGALIADVTVPAKLTADAQIGKRAYEAKCAECHVTNAAGQNGIAPPLVHKIYEPSHHSDMAFVMAAKNGVRAHHWQFGNMAPVGGVTDAEVKLITRYVRELQRENGVF